ncbi:MAG: hypothetical protein IH943_12025 [Acidobacteria bacterium]|nr:hypothetical protein [Acidobacteriota bacterium]
MGIELASMDIVGFINPFPADEQPTDWEGGIVDTAATEELGARWPSGSPLDGTSSQEGPIGSNPPTS